MKRYYFGILAIVLAISFTAFINRPQTNVTLGFTGNPLSSADVADEEKWQQGAPSCDNVDGQACRIVTDISNTKLLGPNRVLDASKVILSTAPGTNGHYVPSPQAGIAITNKT